MSLISRLNQPWADRSSPELKGNNLHASKCRDLAVGKLYLKAQKQICSSISSAAYAPVPCWESFTVHSSKRRKYSLHCHWASQASCLTTHPLPFHDHQPAISFIQTVHKCSGKAISTLGAVRVHLAASGLPCSQRVTGFMLHSDNLQAHHPRTAEHLQIQTGESWRSLTDFPQESKHCFSSSTPIMWKRLW